VLRRKAAMAQTMMQSRLEVSHASAKSRIVSEDMADFTFVLDDDDSYN
jgi:hypothetical protein